MPFEGEALQGRRLMQRMGEAAAITAGEERLSFDEQLTSSVTYKKQQAAIARLAIVRAMAWRGMTAQPHA